MLSKSTGFNESLPINNWIKYILIYETPESWYIPDIRCHWLFLYIYYVCSAISNKSLLLCEKNKLSYSKLFFLRYALKNHLFLALRSSTISIKSIIFFSLKDAFLVTCIPSGPCYVLFLESRWNLNLTICLLFNLW